MFAPNFVLSLKGSKLQIKHQSTKLKIKSRKFQWLQRNFEMNLLIANIFYLNIEGFGYLPWNLSILF